MSITYLNSSWIAGKYPNINAEINITYSYVSIDDYFVQGYEAEEVINRITELYNMNGITPEQSIILFRDMYL